MAQLIEPLDAPRKLEDACAVAVPEGGNPFYALIAACNGEAAEIQALYAAHRDKRNAQQREKFLSAEFRELLIDPVLLRLENPGLEQGQYRDSRNCLVFWARPPDHIVKLACHLQSLLRTSAPNLWLMPPHRMHMTTLEITHSRTPSDTAALQTAMNVAIPAICRSTYEHRSRLVKPMLSYDLAAVALSFLPAAGEKVTSPPPVEPHPSEIAHPGLRGDGEVDSTYTATDAYTYHHLRKHVFDLARETGVQVGSRYVLPSAHITLGRFLCQDDHATPEQRRKWINTIERVNGWLESEIWNSDPVRAAPFIGEWIVGQERGLEARVGPLWYGGGRAIFVGEGF